MLTVDSGLERTRMIRSKLNELKVHLDNIDDWVRQANEMIYRIEEMTFDYEDSRINTLQNLRGQNVFATRL